MTPVALVPSLSALRHTLRAVGFSRVEVVPPPRNAYEQFANDKRVVVAAFV